MRKNSREVIEAAAAAAASLPTGGFIVEADHGIVIVNHPESMKWPEKWPAIKAAVAQLTGMKVSIT